MLKNVIDFVSSRTGQSNREILLREINFAFQEYWNSDDLPNSLFEMSVQPIDDSARISLPYYVGIIRGVKQNWGRMRIHLNTPRPYYQDETYIQDLWTWRVLGISPLITSISNATTLNVSIVDAEDVQFTVTLEGPTDNAQSTREVLTFDVGETEKETISRFTDVTSLVKSIITKSNVVVTTSDEVEISIIPNDAFEARNTIIQITDKCFKVCNNCRCFDILYKKTAPILFYDEDFVPFENVLMTKTLEWMSMAKDGGAAQAEMYAQKSIGLLSQFNTDTNSIEKKMDMGMNQFSTLYRGYL